MIEGIADETLKNQLDLFPGTAATDVLIPDADKREGCSSNFAPDYCSVDEFIGHW